MRKIVQQTHRPFCVRKSKLLANKPPETCNNKYLSRYVTARKWNNEASDKCKVFDWIITSVDNSATTLIRSVICKSSGEMRVLDMGKIQEHVVNDAVLNEIVAARFIGDVKIVVAPFYCLYKWQFFFCFRKTKIA